MVVIPEALALIAVLGIVPVAKVATFLSGPTVLAMALLVEVP